MALTKQARMLAPEEIETVAGWIVTTRQDSVRDLVILYLSVYAGFRAKEIANLSWEMVNQNRDGCIHLTNAASKGFTGGRVVPIHPKLDAALAALARSHAAPPSGRIIRTRRGEPVSPHYVVKKFGYWYWLLDMKGCSSHSGRRTFITTAARTIAAHGGSLQDVRDLAGHTTLAMTQRYIVVNEEAKRGVVKGM